MTLKELQPQLLALSSVEKAQAIQFLLQNLSYNLQGIEKTAGVCGGDACIRSTRIPVWLLVSYRQQGTSDAKILDAYPSLTAIDLANAWMYAESHPEEIEIAIRRNEED
ncbi:MAG: hypothetical protein DCF19_10015 [Pseudanabaena frigida]|uniref:DUF433 domain-containing protein n=1 Tax=Pseudanabaena frigida TaxID=945775 RepID=A0A2W4W8V3_9CYAN|nr:MAG: hypothetical protein DCF19_10015 [Pseudanabaena frigida]